MFGNLFIKNGSQLITCTGFKAKKGREMQDIGIIEDGAVLVQNGKITITGKTADIEAHLDRDALSLERFDTIDASGKIVLPGLVDSHTHLVFGGDRADEFISRVHGMPYMDILRQGGGILRTVEHTRNDPEKELAQRGMERLDAMLSFGITTVEGKSGYGLDKETEMKQLEVMKTLHSFHPLDVVSTFLGAHAVPPSYRESSDTYLDFLLSSVMPKIRERNLADFCDIFCEAHVFSVDQSRRFLEAAKQMGFGLKFHADKLSSAGGAELAASIGALSADHLLMASDKGIKALADAGVVATLLPGTAFCLKQPFARARFMIDAGCAVALATDFNPGSCATYSAPFIIALAVIYMGMTIEEAITAFTINGAAAIGRSHLIGSIDPGKAGDLVVMDVPTISHIPYHTAINPVVITIKGGNVVWRHQKGICYPTSR